MDTFKAMAMGMANRGRPRKVFDWKKAAELIRDRTPAFVEAGLREDWDYTSGVIFEDGKIDEECYTYLASNWATPQICMDGEFIDCFVMECDTEWRSDTKWPDVAREIVLAKVST